MKDNHSQPPMLNAISLFSNHFLLSLVLCLMLLDRVSSNYDKHLVRKFFSQRDTLIQDGLSYFNGTKLQDVRQKDANHEVRCIITVENWSKWMLSFPVYWTYSGGFQRGFHEREVFAGHREIAVAVNPLDSMKGSAGVVAWELGDKNIHLIVMWSIPYYMSFYNAYFGFGMVQLTTKFSQDMLPYWYQRMYDGDAGPYKRAKAGESLFFKHHEIFILGQLEADTYHPVLNLSVVPWSTGNLAPTIWNALREKSDYGRMAEPFSAAGRPLPLAGRLGQSYHGKFKIFGAKLAALLLVLERLHRLTTTTLTSHGR